MCFSEVKVSGRWHGLTEEQVKEEVTDIENLKKIGFDYIDGGNSAGYILRRLRKIDKLEVENKIMKETLRLIALDDSYVSSFQDEYFLNVKLANDCLYKLGET